VDVAIPTGLDFAPKGLSDVVGRPTKEICRVCCTASTLRQIVGEVSNTSRRHRIQMYAAVKVMVTMQLNGCSLPPEPEILDEMKNSTGFVQRQIGMTLRLNAIFFR